MPTRRFVDRSEPEDRGPRRHSFNNGLEERQFNAELKRVRKTARFQMDRRRNTKVPGYGAHLPKVFPLKKDMSREHATLLIDELLVVQKEGFALTSHPSTVDGHVTLWLSVDCTEYLQASDLLGSVDPT